jgi:hypothetical protein
MKTDCFKGLSSSYTRLAHLIGLQPDEVGSDTQHLECGITLSFSLALELYTCGLGGRDMFPTPWPISPGGLGEAVRSKYSHLSPL